MMKPWPFGELRPLHYGVLVVDPPWETELYSERGQGKAPQRHYRCLPLDQILAFPIGSLAAGDAVCAIWTTQIHVDKALLCMAHWGFTLKTFGAWHKLTPGKKPKTAFGTGYIYRSAAEFWAVGTVGRPKLRWRSARNLIMAPRRQHSRKPEQMREDLERMYAGPYAEIFARPRRAGWDCWGDELGKHEGEDRSPVPARREPPARPAPLADPNQLVLCQ